MKPKNFYGKSTSLIIFLIIKQNMTFTCDIIIENLKFTVSIKKKHLIIKKSIIYILLLFITPKIYTWMINIFFFYNKLVLTIIEDNEIKI
jgi:hypothetical protein